MVELIRKQIRSSTDINFYSSSEWSNEFKNYWNETYIISKKIKFSKHDLSEDKLTLTSTYIWDSNESLQEYLTDPMVYKNITIPSEKYNLDNNIKKELISIKDI